ncbi:MAG: hypothetical protein IID61_01490 [SAR324 cluster bacterium]|nr:hypothetical protein [SAR324 cluster bacterium]
MPITDTLQNAKRLEATGATPELSQAISAIVEDAAQAGQQDLKEFIRQEFAAFRTQYKADMQAQSTELKQEIGELRTVTKQEIAQARAESREYSLKLQVEMHSLARDQLLKIVAAMAMMLGIVTAIIKLFPNA